MASKKPDGDIWNIVDNDEMSQHYGRNFKFDFSYISSDEIKELFKDYVWQNHRVHNKTLNSLYYEVTSFFYRFIQFADTRNITSLKRLSKAHAKAKNKATIDKVNKAIDKLKRKGKPINFETVCKEAGVSRATLYNNPQLKERILSLRAISKASPLDDVVAVKKDKLQLKDDKISALREQIKKLENDKKKLIEQLVDYEELKAENERLKKQLVKQT